MCPTQTTYLRDVGGRKLFSEKPSGEWFSSPHMGTSVVRDHHLHPEVLQGTAWLSPNTLSIPLHVSWPRSVRQLCRALEGREPCLGLTHGLHLAQQKASELSLFFRETALGQPSKNGSKVGKSDQGFPMKNAAFSLKSQSVNLINFWSAVFPLQCGKPPKGQVLFMKEPPLSCHAEIHSYQPEISNPPAASLKQNT